MVGVWLQHFFYLSDISVSRLIKFTLNVFKIIERSVAEPFLCLAAAQITITKKNIINNLYSFRSFKHVKTLYLSKTKLL